MTEFSFDQKLDILWSACALGLEESPIVKDFYEDLNLMNFNRTDNDLTYQQFDKVRDFMIYLNRVSSLKDKTWVKEGLNEQLELLVKNPTLHQMRYEEHEANFDPFKKRVLEGITKGLTMASIDHQEMMQDNMFHQKQQDVDFNEDRYPFTPDLIVGYKGNKVLLDVITSS